MVLLPDDTIHIPHIMKNFRISSFVSFFIVIMWPIVCLAGDLNNAIRFDLTKTWASSKEANAVWAVGSKAYLANGNDGITVLDITDPSQPHVVRRYLYQSATRIIGDENHVYALIKGQVVNNQVQKDRILIFNVSSDPEPLIGEYRHDSFNNLGCIAKSGDILYATTSSSLILVDVGDPSQPVKMIEYNIGSTNLSSPGIAVDNDIAYVAAGTQHLKLLDVSDPYDVRLMSEYETDMWAINVTVSGTTAFVTGWEGGLLAIDVGDPHYPVKAGDYNIVSPYRAIDIIVSGHFGYLSYINPDNREGGIIGLNLQDPTSIETAGEYTQLEWVNDIFMADDHLLVPNKNNLTILKPFLYHKIKTGLSLVPNSVAIPQGNTRKVSIVGGKEPFHISSSNPSIATAFVDQNGTLSINTFSQGNVLVTVTDGTGSQSVLQVSVIRKVKAIIVAGSGPYTGNHLWDATLACVQHAYKVLQYQGYTHDTIQLLASDTTLDIDGDGLFNEVDAHATANDLRRSIIEWEPDAGDVLVYLTGHGSDGYFKIDQNEHVDARTLNNWLNTLEDSADGTLTIVYDACRAGSFIPHLISDTGKQRIILTSAAPNENAYFTSIGSLSFSNLFWTQIHKGANISDAFFIAKNAIEFTYANQTPQMDDNGNGIGNDINDGVSSKSARIGNGVVVAGDIPEIKTISSDIALHGEISADFSAELFVSGSNSIQRVWAVITPPGCAPTDPDSPVLNLPTVEMNPTGDTRYTGTYSDFSQTGTYNVAVYAMDTEGYISTPRRIAVTQTSAISLVTGISQLYVAIFGRASEGEGNLFWQGYDSDRVVVADAMLATDAAQQYFGDSLNSDQAFIEHIYWNTLSKAPTDDPDGIAYWVDKLGKSSSRGAVAVSLVGVINHYAPGGSFFNPEDTKTIAAYNQFTNRVAVSDYMASTVYKSPVDWSVSTTFNPDGLNVTHDPNSVSLAKARVDSF